MLASHRAQVGVGMNQPMRYRVKKGSRGLTLTHGAPGPGRVRRSEEARAAGQQVGIRFLAGNAKKWGRTAGGCRNRPAVQGCPRGRAAGCSVRAHLSPRGPVVSDGPRDRSARGKQAGNYLCVRSRRWLSRIPTRRVRGYLGNDSGQARGQLLHSICPGAARRGVRTRPRESP
jgi:hypothetical protein